MRYNGYIDDFICTLLGDLKSDVRQKQNDIEKLLNTANVDKNLVEANIDHLVDCAASHYVREGMDWVIDLNAKDDEELAEMIKEDSEIADYIIEPSEMLKSLCDLNRL